MKLVSGKITEITLKNRVLTVHTVLPNGMHLIFCLIFRPDPHRPGEWTVHLIIEQVFGGKNHYPLGEFVFDSRGKLIKMIIPDFDLESSDAANYSLLDTCSRSITDPTGIQKYLAAGENPYLLQLFPSCLQALRSNQSPVVREYKKKYALLDAYHQGRDGYKSKILDQSIRKQDLQNFLVFEYLINHHEQFFRLAP